MPIHKKMNGIRGFVQINVDRHKSLSDCCQLSNIDLMNLTRQEKIDALKKWLARTYLDPSVTKQTLGEELSSVSPRALLLSSAKLVKINKKEVEPDDRDNLRYSNFLGIEDYIGDHIEKDSGGMRKKAAMRMQQKKNLTWLTPSFFTPQIKSVIIGNSLSNNVEGINPMEHYDNAHRVTKMGEGGIVSDESIPKESRQISESSFGFYDFLHLAESTKIGVTQYVAGNTLKGKDNRLYKLVKDKTGKLKWVDHESLLNSRVKIPES